MKIISQMFLFIFLNSFEHRFTVIVKKKEIIITVIKIGEVSIFTEIREPNIPEDRDSTIWIGTTIVIMFVIKCTIQVSQSGNTFIMKRTCWCQSCTDIDIWCRCKLNVVLFSDNNFFFLEKQRVYMFCFQGNNIDIFQIDI